MDRVLVFDIWGDYGHFRKFYTTTSPLTFAFPPRTAICGLVGAIIGLDKGSEYLERLSGENFWAGVRILEPLRFTRMMINLIDTTTSPASFHRIQQRTQVRFEFVKDPKYRIYVRHEDEEIMRKLKGFLQEHKTYYTPCLGLSELIANFEFVGECGLREEDGGEVEIKSVVPEKYLLGGFEFENGVECFSVRVPNKMDVDRKVVEYQDVMFERNAKPLKVRVNRYWHVEGMGENILFL